MDRYGLPSLRERVQSYGVLRPFCPKAIMLLVAGIESETNGRTALIGVGQLRQTGQRSPQKTVAQLGPRFVPCHGPRLRTRLVDKATWQTEAAASNGQY